MTFVAGQFSIQGGTGRAAEIVGDILGLSFEGTLFSNSQTAGGIETCTITVDGPTFGSPIGSVSFRSIHTESDYNFAGTMSDICVGKTNKFGSVNIDGGNSWGSGDGTHFTQYFLRVPQTKGAGNEHRRVSDS